MRIGPYLTSSLKNAFHIDFTDNTLFLLLVVIMWKIFLEWAEISLEWS